MPDVLSRRWPILLAMFPGAVGFGCNLVLGLDAYTDVPTTAAGTGGEAGAGTGGHGGSGTSSSSTGGAGSGGAGGGPVCEQGATMPCYTGPSGTENTGICKDGAAMCKPDGTGFGACEGDVTPAAETCADTADENCDGYDCVQWAAMYGDGDAQFPSGVTVDAAGNSYLFGTFFGAIPFPGNTLISAGKTALFLAKFDPAGKHVWSKQFGDVDYLDVRAVAIDASGNVLLGGFSAGTISFGGANLPAGTYVAKLDPSGQHLWSKGLGGNMNCGFPYLSIVTGVGFDPQGNALISGTYCGSINFGDGAIASQGGSADGFVAKLRGSDGSGKVADGGWSKVFGDNLQQVAYALAVDAQGSAIVAGNFAGSINLGGGALTSAGGTDVFLAKFTSVGSLSWSATFGNGGEQYVNSLSLDDLGGPVLTGALGGTVDFGGGPITGGWYVAKYTSGKIHQWSKPISSGAGISGPYVAVDAGGNVFLTGGFKGTMDLGGGPLTSTGASGDDIFLAKLSDTGAWLWNRTFGDGTDQYARGVGVTPAGEPIVTGQAQGMINFGTGPLTSAGSYDAFIAKFSP